MKRSAARPRRTRLVLLPLAAAALVGAVLPVSAGGASAAEPTPSASPSASPTASPTAGATASPSAAPVSTKFSGYSSSGYAAPVRLEVYEPTIPIPAEPQAEVDFAYSSVKADTGSSRGRASYFWPGDAVGEGAKTILENLGVPLPSSITAGGYPVQVNSVHPGGPDSDYNEPAPGVLQRTAAGDATTYAQTGYAGDGDPENGSGTDPNADAPTDGSAPADPAGDPVGAIGGLLANGPTGVLGAVTGGLLGTGTGGTTGGSSTGAPGLPSATAAIVDFGGVVSIARSTAGTDRVRMHSRAKVSDINILGGILQIGSVETDVQTIGNGDDAKTETTATYGDMSIAGQKFTIGPDGVVAAGSPVPGIPGLPTDPAAALKQLGISITVPQPDTKVDGLLGTATRQGLRIDIDTLALRSQLDALPLADLANMLPDETGQLKSVLQAAVGAHPRMVVVLATTTASTETVKPLDLDPVTAPTDEPSATPSASPTAAPAAAPAGGTPGGTAGAPLAGAPAGLDVPTAGGDLTDAAPVAALDTGLPDLFSIPGALLYGGLLLGGLVGTYFRRLGLLALGGGGSCPHGLDSGLPDLRRI